MKLLLDANTAWRLINRLSATFEEVNHVDKINLSIPASDIDIWKWAKSNGAIIITNDEDFQNLLIQKGFPPKMVLLRTGNQSTQHIADLLIKHKSDIELLSDSSSYGLLELY